MEDTLKEGLCVSGRPRKTIPRVKELFGDMEPFPVFRDIAAVCDSRAHSHAFAWPLRFPFPPSAPGVPDFAGLTSLYCNHLACILAPVERPIEPDEAGYATQATGELVFLGLAARSYAVRLPATVVADVYLDAVTTVLLGGMRVTRAADEALWSAVHRSASIALENFARGHGADHARLASELTGYFLHLPLLMRRCGDHDLQAVYNDGRHLREAVCKRVALGS